MSETEIDADADTEIDVESGIDDSDEGKENRDPLQETVAKIGRREFTYKERISFVKRDGSIFIVWLHLTTTRLGTICRTPEKKKRKTGGIRSRDSID